MFPPFLFIIVLWIKKNKKISFLKRESDKKCKKNHFFVDKVKKCAKIILAVKIAKNERFKV